ncbi:MAG: hypothetical protein ACD_75C01426G0001 [uncultured bacterium]|nr:MAG: hypothetical protein ACD_75C01426G0001 [uncultured bacterium]
MDFLDWQWLARQPVVEQGTYVRQVRFAKPFSLKCDGTRSESVLLHADGTPCRMVCKIQGKETWNQSVLLQGECSGRDNQSH